jgi:hypothetical protein
MEKPEESGCLISARVFTTSLIEEFKQIVEKCIFFVCATTLVVTSMYD